MPVLHYGDRRIDVPRGKVLRKALLEAGESPHNGAARGLNCRGLGSCGTCALAIEFLDGESPPLTRMERWRLGFPPHRRERGLRLACQVRVEGDLRLTKHPGFWGSEPVDPG